MEDLNFDWVTARATCNAERVFLDLREEVARDVTTRNDLVTIAQKQDYIGFQFESHEHKPNAFAVVRNGASIVSRVNFRREKGTIKAIDVHEKVIVEATLTLNDAGQCNLKIEGVGELTNWQFRRRALQNLFFGF